MFSTTKGDVDVLIWAGASEELGGIDLGDARLNKRGALLVERLAESPSDSIPHACQGWAEIQAVSSPESKIRRRE